MAMVTRLKTATTMPTLWENDWALEIQMLTGSPRMMGLPMALPSAMRIRSEKMWESKMGMQRGLRLECCFGMRMVMLMG